jgi:CheY-like chemotaxis protein
MTAHYEPHGARLAKEAGCVAYLMKPYPPAELVTVIKRVIAEGASV